MEQHLYEWAPVLNACMRLTGARWWQWFHTVHSFKKVEERAKKQQKHQQRQWRRSMKTTDVSWERMQQSTRSPWGHTLNDNTTAVCLQENTKIIFYHKGAAHSPSGIGSIHAHKLLMLLVSINIFVFVQLRICVQKESLTTITAP